MSFIPLKVDIEDVFEDLEERKAEFQELHNELRTLLGKEPREYVEQCKEQVKNEL